MKKNYPSFLSVLDKHFKTMSKTITTIIKVLAWILAGIIGLLLLVALLIQTSFVKKKIAGIAETQAASFVEGKLTLGSITGNFFTGIQLNEVLWMNGSDTLAYIPEISTTYRLLPLLNSRLVIRTASIERPRFFLKQDADSTWNVQHLIKPQPVDTLASDTSASKFAIDVARFSINQAYIGVQSFDTIIPEEIINLNLLLSGYYSSDNQNVELKRFNFVTRQPDFTLKELTLDFSRNQAHMQLKDFKLVTARNQVVAHAAYQAEGKRMGTASIQTEPVNIEEFKFILPDITLPAHPYIDFDAELIGDQMNANLVIADEGQELNMNLISGNLYAFLTDTTMKDLQYLVNATIKQIDVAHWTGESNLNYIINGSLKIDGSGISPESAVVELVGDFYDLRVSNKPVDKLDLDLNYNKGDVKGLITGNGNFGSFRVIPDARNLMGDNPDYKVLMVTRNLNLAMLTGNDSLYSSLNVNARLSGRGIDPNTLTADADIKIHNSTFQTIHLDTLLANVGYRAENIDIDSLLLATESLRLTAHGRYSMNASSSVKLNASFSGLDEFRAFIPVDSLETSGTLEANLAGTPDSLKLIASLKINETRYGSLLLEALQLDANAFIAHGDTLVHAGIRAKRFSTGSFVLDSINMNVDASMDSVYLAGNVSNQDLSATIKSGLTFGTPMNVRLDDLVLDYKDQHLELQQSPALISIGETAYQIDNLKMASADSDSAQAIQIAGVIDRSGTQDLAVNVTNVNIGELVNSFNEEMKASGIFSLNLKISGSAAAPVMDAKFALEEASLNDYKFTEFGGTFGLKNNELNVAVNLIPADSGKISIEGQIPASIRLDSMQFEFNPEAPLDAKFIADRFPLGVIRAFNITEDIAGFLQADVNISGTVKDPRPEGNLRLVDASVKVPEYGIDYKTIKLNVNFTPEEIILDTFNITSQDGAMYADGKLNFRGGFYKGDISDSKISVFFDKFNPFDHKQFNMMLSGQADLKGKPGEVVFSGDLKIPESEFNLPAVMALLGKFSAPEMPTPILVRELTEHKHQGDSLITHRPIASIDTAGPTLYLENVSGKLKVNIPKNTWIKSEDLRLELSGDIELIKTRAYFEIFGTVDVVRGQYEILGRTFKIDKGHVSLQGGEKINPVMDITASYTFRNTERAEQELTVNITGDIDTPAVKFELDGSAISEGDAMSYIMFGKSLDQLTLDQQQNVEGAGGGSVAANAAASILSSQLTKFLGNTLNVDYIELKSGDGFDNATLIVGKYITNDLFVSYEQLFGQTSENNAKAYEVKLEYEIFRWLFLQLNNSSRDSGFDVIYKFESE